MKRVASLFVLAALSGCQDGQVVDVTLLPDGRVQIVLPDHRETCITQLQIRRADSNAAEDVIWDIRQTSTGQCLKRIAFPDLPVGFTAQTPARPLKPGKYWITGDAYGLYLSGDLDVPASQ